MGDKERYSLVKCWGCGDFALPSLPCDTCGRPQPPQPPEPRTFEPVSDAAHVKAYAAVVCIVLAALIIGWSI